MRRNFRQNIEIVDPVTHEEDKKPLKLFMVSQLQVAFERDQIILSPFDEKLHKQLIDYEVIKRTGITNDPVFTDKNEHFVDALGLAYVAFVLEFNELIEMVKKQEIQSIMNVSQTSIAKKSVKSLYAKTATHNVYDRHNGICDPFQDEVGSEVLIPVPVKNISNNSRMITSSICGRKNTSKRQRRSSW